MCSSPIMIRNGSRRYRDGVDKMFFHVPCGHCKECIERKKDDWFVRAFFEYQRVIKCGGSAFFPTFSYNEENLPIYRDGDFSCPVFDPTHVKRLRDKLRVYLGRNWYVKKGKNGDFVYKSARHTSVRIIENLKKQGFQTYWKHIDFSDDRNKIRFFISCEYGHQYGRSHLHGLFFVPFKITPSQMLFFFQRSWSYGFTMQSKKHGLKVKSANAVRYCMKYIEKPDSWSKKYGVYEYIDSLKNEIEVFEKTDFLPFSQAEIKLKEFRRITPSHFQSTGFGFDLIPYLEDNKDVVLDGEIDLSKFQFLTKNRFKFQIPRYLLRKVLYEKDSENTDIPTKYHKEIFFERILKMFNSDLQKYSFLSDKRKFYNHVSFLKIDNGTLDSLWVKIWPVKDKIPQLIVYNYVYRHIPVVDTPAFADLDWYMENALDFAFNQKFNYNPPVPRGESFRDKNPHKMTDERFCYGNLSVFHGFDDALRTIEHLDTMISDLTTRSYMLKLSNMNLLWKFSDIYQKYNFCLT